jgi:hypothetical protein
MSDDRIINAMRIRAQILRAEADGMEHDGIEERPAADNPIAAGRSVTMLRVLAMEFETIAGSASMMAPPDAGR